jgi:hypothetical protein
VKDLTAGLPTRINMHGCMENDQGVPNDFMDRRDLRWRNEDWRASEWYIHGPSPSCVINFEVVHPRSQTSFGRFFDVPMKVENREKDCREKERVDDPEYH